jgi:hypothetical protein
MYIIYSDILCIYKKFTYSFNQAVLFYIYKGVILNKEPINVWTSLERDYVFEGILHSNLNTIYIYN